MNYRYLTQAQRYQIQVPAARRLPNRSIAVQVGCHPSTISRERRRIGAQGGYQAATAQRQARDRWQAASSVPRIDPSTWREIERGLREDWSPEEIAVRRRQQRRCRVSHERIY